APPHRRPWRRPNSCLSCRHITSTASQSRWSSAKSGRGSKLDGLDGFDVAGSEGAGSEGAGAVSRDIETAGLASCASLPIAFHLRQQLLYILNVCHYRGYSTGGGELA